MKKILKIIIVIIAIIIIATIAGIFSQGTVLPWLSSFESLENNKFLKMANEKVTIINKTEQITVKEDFSVTKTTENVSPSVVSVITLEEEGQNTVGSQTIKSSKDIQQNIKTGVIVTSDGVIVSVMDDLAREALSSEKKTKYRILMPDGKELDAKMVAVDPYNELVFYKTEADNLPVVSFGNSSDLINGEKLVVVGNASGEYQNTFTVGIIQNIDQTFSLLNSELSSSEKMEGAIITGAMINESNVGGPAVDFNGTMAGLANQIQKDGKLTGFVIPMSQVKESMDRYVAEGRIQRPELGIYYLSINREIALLNNLPVNEGALIYSFSGQQGLAVLQNSPADKAGLKLGDIVVLVNEERVDLDNPLSKLIAKYKKGDKVELKILRNEEAQIVSVVLN